MALAFVSWLAFGTESWQAFFHWMPMFSQAFLTEGKAPWWKLQSIFALVRYFGGTEQLAWGFQWVLTASVAVVLALLWRSRVPYTVKAAALAVGTLLTTPYLFMYDVMVLAIPVAFLVRIGLKRGFRPYELPALGCAALLIIGFICSGVPLGFGAMLIVAGAGAAPGWSVVASRACADAGCRGRLRLPKLARRLPLSWSFRLRKSVLSGGLNSCSLLQSGWRSIAQNVEEARVPGPPKAC